MIKQVSAAAAAFLLLCGPALAAPINKGPPAEGRTILDLDGHGTSNVLGTVLPVFASTTFVATAATTRLTFAMRSDHQLNEFLYLSDISLEETHPTADGGHFFGPDMIANGQFDDGSLPPDASGVQQPFGWTYDRPADAPTTSAGTVIVNPFVAATTLPCDDPPCSQLQFPRVFADVSVGEYDALSQTLSTVVGETYALSFSVWDLSETTGFSRTDVEGPNRPSNGNDVVVSATDIVAGQPHTSHVDFTFRGKGSAAPEPAAWVLIIAGFFGLGARLRGRRAALAL